MKSSSPIAHLEKLSRHSRDILCTIDHVGHILFVNEAVSLLLGYQPQQVTGSLFTQYLPLPDVDAATQALASLKAAEDSSAPNPSTFENRVLHATGQPVLIEWAASWSLDDNCFYCVGRHINGRQKQRHAFQEKEKVYQALAQQGTDMLALLDENAVFTYSGGSTAKLLGYEPHDLIGKSVFHILHEEDAPRAQEVLTQLATSKQAIRVSDLRIKTKHGDYKWLETTASNQLATPHVNGLVLTSRDVTERVLTRLQLQEREQHFRSLFENSPEMIIFENPKGIILDANPSFLNYFSLRKPTIVGTVLAAYLPEATAAACHASLQEALQGKTVSITLQVEIELMGHRVFEVSKIPVVTQQKTTGVYSILKDVTERVRASQELEKLSLVASKTSNGIVIMDAQGQIEWVNDGFTNINGYTLAEVKGRRPNDFFHGPNTDPETRKRIFAGYRSGQPFREEILNYKKSGEEFWVKIDVTPVKNEEGQVIRFIAIQTDVTYRKEAEKEQLLLTRELYEQNRDLQQFTYIVSHNLRAPVANALGLAALLPMVERDSAVYTASLANLKASVVQIDSVLKDLNHILSIRDHRNTMERHKVNLAQKCQQTVESLRETLEASHASYTLDVPEDMYVRGNEAYLFSIFYNLLANSIKYRSPDRRLHVQITAQQNTRDGVTVSFTDNGLGFDVQKAGNNVFKLYKRFHKNADGKGIGLFLVKTHVESLGGQIEVHSEVNKGTTFLIHLK
ncbi:PAS domain S-box protein [Nibribacter koreensis]|uniref:histidine kinase n=1 Tax=Nibribacter koreensis TaxID=1084519 RepID=A0ABP8G2D4_9BACT